MKLDITNSLAPEEIVFITDAIVMPAHINIYYFRGGGMKIVHLRTKIVVRGKLTKNMSSLRDLEEKLLKELAQKIIEKKRNDMLLKSKEET